MRSASCAKASDLGFDRHLAPELGVGGAVHLTQATLAELGDNAAVRDGLLRAHRRSPAVQLRTTVIGDPPPGADVETSGLTMNRFPSAVTS
jgi:hypothetical protein